MCSFLFEFYSVVKNKPSRIGAYLSPNATLTLV